MLFCDANNDVCVALSQDPLLVWNYAIMGILAGNVSPASVKQNQDMPEGENERISGLDATHARVVECAAA